MPLIPSCRTFRVGLPAALIAGALLSVPLAHGSAQAGNYPSAARTPHEKQQKHSSDGNRTSPHSHVVLEMEDMGARQARRAFRNKPAGTLEQVTAWHDAFDRVGDMLSGDVVHISGRLADGGSIFLQGRRTDAGNYRYYLMVHPKDRTPSVFRGSFDDPSAEAAEAEKSFPVVSLSIKLLMKSDGAGQYQTASGKWAPLV